MDRILEQIWVLLCGVWRYRWYSVVVAWVVSIAGWYHVAKMPDIYKADARIYVDTESVLMPLMRGLTVDTGISQRLQLLTRTLLSRPMLEQLAIDAGLAVEDGSRRQLDAAINRLKNSIQLIGERQQPNLYTLSYQDRNPLVARQVIDQLIELLEESTLGKKRQESTEAQSFLEKQVKEYEARLRQAEDRLKDFKRENVDVMTGMDVNYFHRLATAKEDLEQAELELKEAVNSRDELKRQLYGEEPVFGFGAGGLTSTRDPIDIRIQDLEERMNKLLLQYTENHPDIVTIKQIIGDLQVKKREQEQSISTLSLAISNQLEMSPVYQQLKISIGQADAQIALLRVRVSEYRSRVTRLEGLINSVPEIEAQLTRLNRNYENDKAQYDAMVTRLESAKLSEQVESSGDGVKINLIEPSQLPRTPAGPNRLLLNSGVLLGSVAIGVMLAFLLSQVAPAIYSQRELRSLTGLPVIAEISIVLATDQLMKRRARLGGFLSFMMLLLVMYGLVLYTNGFRSVLSG